MTPEMREFCESIRAVRRGEPDPHPDVRPTGRWVDDASFEHPDGLMWSPEQWEGYEQRARDEYAPNWRRR